MFNNEKDYFKPGNNGLPIFDIGKCKIGMLVCFDWMFPEVWRILALKGAEIICHPSNFVLKDLALKALPCHALTNKIYIITSNRIGTEKEIVFTGNSQVINPQGEILIKASQSIEEAIVIDIDISQARDKNVTCKNNIFDDRRSKEYTFLYRK